MSSPRGMSPLSYRRIGRADLGVIRSVELEPEQLRRFIGSIDDIIAAVRGGLAHAVVGIERAGLLVGFYVVHPDRRDASCWWLGWLAVDRRQQGHGYGRLAMAHIMRHLRRIAVCRRMRLHVDPGNANALRLYRAAGFCQIGVHTTGELILEAVLSVLSNIGGLLAPVVSSAMPKRTRRKSRVRLAPGPHATYVIEVERGPPCPAA